MKIFGTRHWFMTRLMGCLLALCSAGVSLAASPVLDRVVDTGVLRVAMSADQPPFSLRNREQVLIGYDVDLAKALAEVMKVQLEIVEIPFANLLDTLLDNRVDMVISGLTITPERTRKVSFIGPYVLSGKSILTTSRIENVVKDVSQFNDPAIRMVALGQSTSEIFAERNFPDADFHAIANYDEGVQMLLTGRIDAMIADIPILKLTMMRYPDAGLSLLEPPLSVESIGIAISPDDNQFESLLRNYLFSFETNGMTLNWYRKWFEDISWVAQLP
ncbi:MAG: transporter substrate-binding domain-containing protein [Pseudomonadota bacterium]